VSALRALIVDDEPLAREGIALLLSREPGWEVIGACGSAAQAAREIERGSPDVVFLDIQMPGKSGLDLADSLGAANAPRIVFVTAYDEHALRAFDLGAIDYVLKPVDEERFAATLRRVRTTLQTEARAGERDRLAAVLAELRSVTDVTMLPSTGRYLERLTVRTGDATIVVRVADIDWIEADRDYMRVHAGGKSSLVRLTMAELERRLDPARVMRVHRSSLVNLDAVRGVEPFVGGEYLLLLRGGAKVKVSRSYRDRVLAALGAAP
jgi:two-component system LytT family response regulator